jgi:hypothetical protein
MKVHVSTPRRELCPEKKPQPQAGGLVCGWL